MSQSQVTPFDSLAATAAEAAHLLRRLTAAQQELAEAKQRIADLEAQIGKKDGKQ